MEEEAVVDTLLMVFVCKSFIIVGNPIRVREGDAQGTMSLGLGIPAE